MVDYKKLSAEYSQRFGYAISAATHSDYFSVDGKTWDLTADWTKDANHVFAAEDFQAYIFNQIKIITAPSNKKPPTMEQLPEELRAWLLRVEARG
jgi:hypothetical protein